MNEFLYRETSNPIYFLNTHGVFILIFVVLFYMWFIRRSKEETIHIIVAIFVAGAASLFLKEIFNIPRPYIVYDLEPQAGFSVRTASLPSLHTTLAFALATIVTLHQRKLGICLFVLASIIGFGRIVAHVHYPIDVAFGAIVGSVFALLVENIRLPRHKLKG
jgi:undecaprenyl-diphosphatase